MKKKRPRDPNQLAKLIVDAAIGEAVLPENVPDGKNIQSVLNGQKGGLKGGRARATKLPPSRRKEIAKKAAKKRWKN